MKTFKWGVLGVAKIAMEHVIPAMQRNAHCEITAIASRSQERAQAAAAQCGIEKAYGDYEAMLADDDIDAIYNPLPNHLHVPLTLKALEHGKHVLCEKPIALTAQEAETLRDAAAASGLIVAEAFMVRHHPQWKTARDIARSGRIGEVKAMHVFFSYFLDDPDNVRNKADIGGGGLLDIGCYAVNTSRYIFGAEPDRVIGLIERDPDFGTDRLASGLVAFPGSRQLTFTCATQLTLYQTVTIVGSKGRITIPIAFNAPADTATFITVDDGRDLSGGGAETIEIAPCNQYGLQGDAFVQMIVDGVSSPPLDDAVANMKVLDALFRSADTNTWEAP